MSANVARITMVQHNDKDPKSQSRTTTHEAKTRSKSPYIIAHASKQNVRVLVNDTHDLLGTNTLQRPSRMP